MSAAGLVGDLSNIDGSTTGAGSGGGGLAAVLQDQVDALLQSGESFLVEVCEATFEASEIKIYSFVTVNTFVVLRSIYLPVSSSKACLCIPASSFMFLVLQQYSSNK